MPTPRSMAARADRIEARIAPERAKRIRYASGLLHQSISAFMMDAAVEKAEAVIAPHAYTAADARYFDRLLRALDAPGVSLLALRHAAATTRKRPAFRRS